MNPQNGQIYAMGSKPTFNPIVFTKPISYASPGLSTNARHGGDPLLNRAIQSAGPTGSTFKPITATAALAERRLDDRPTRSTTPGQFCFRARRDVPAQRRATPSTASLDLVNAIRVSVRRLLLQPRRG